MEQNTFTEKLMLFGLTRQEAAVYESLLTAGKSSGYEVAKTTGISRSNAYSALSNLTDKGAAYVAEEGTAKKYVPVSIEEFSGNYMRKLETAGKWLFSHAPREREAEDGYITIEGAGNIRDKTDNLLEQVRERVYITCSHKELAPVKKKLMSLAGQGKKVVVITDRREHIEGAKVYVSDERGSQIGLIVDSRYALTGEFGENSQNTCLYSGQKNFVTLYKNALANEIKLIQYKDKEGEKESE